MKKLKKILIVQILITSSFVFSMELGRFSKKRKELTCETKFDYKELSQKLNNILSLALKYESCEEVYKLVKNNSLILFDTKLIIKAFIMAASCNDLELVMLFKEKYFNIDLQDEDGDTALMVASGLESLEVVKYLLKRNANVFIKNNSGETAYTIAVSNCNFEIEELIKKKIIKKLNN